MAGLPAALRRHLRSLGRFWSTSLAAEMEYQANLLVELLAVVGNLAGSLFTLSLFYGHGQQLGGWSWDQALVVLGLYTLLDGFAGTLLRPNLGNLVKQVQSGSLDFVLLKPIDSQFWVSLRSFSPWGLPEMAVGLGLALVGAARAGARVNPASAATALLMLACGLAILYSLWFVLAATSIWFVKVWNATEVLRSALAAGRYPVSAYPPALRFVFTVVLPVAFLTTVPAQAILGLAEPRWVLASVVMAVLALAASRTFWRFALRHYTSASS
jgi:ABC-2 type transport system permease protein